MYLILHFMFLHWIADFVCQTRWMADNKSKNWKALFLHVLTYSAVMSFGFIAVYINTYFLKYDFILFLSILSIKFFILTFVSHYITDAITSRITSNLYKKNDIHGFFTIIGLDQFIHLVTICLTLKCLGASL